MTNAPQDFWSRRRAAVQAEAEADIAAVQAVEAAQEAEARAKAEAEKTDEELLQEYGLPDPDSLKPGDDFSAFMAKAVPERLRRRALRKLWVSNPVLANLDGLTDYSDDFTDAATVIPDLKTAYQVGKGMFEHVRRLAEGVEEGPAEQTEEPQAEAILAEAEAIEDPVAPSLRADPEMDVPVEDVDLPADPAPQPRRHMRFAFNEQD